MGVDEVIEFLRVRGAVKVQDLKKEFGDEFVEGLKNDNRFTVIKTEDAEYLDLKESWEGVFEAIERQLQEKEKQKEALERQNKDITLDDYFAQMKSGV